MGRFFRGNHFLPAMLRALLALLLTGFAAAQAAAQTPRPPLLVLTPAQALAEDAREYARDYGVPPEEAVMRLKAQEETVAATNRLQEKYRKRLAGISIDHSPEYRIVVLLTGKKRVPDETLNVGAMTVPIVFRTGASATREEVVAAIRRHGAKIRRSLPAAGGMGLDPRTGELVLMVRDRDARRHGVEAIEERLEALTGVPARVRLLDGPIVNADLSGGARIVGPDAVTGRPNYCTTGFVVTDGARTGIVTAAHCPDDPTYLDPAGEEIALSFGGQWGWSHQDVQLHVSDRAQRPLFYADSGKTAARTVTGWRTRASTRAGDRVCHRGETSGYSCAEVELVDFAPPGELCGGPCDAVWVTVAGPSCRGGDSGGPVFSGTTAFGIVKGASYSGDGQCKFYFYMSTDYLPDGWSLLREEAPPGS